MNIIWFQQSKTWANITYGTQDEAQAAIEDVDGRPPHKFSVKFALSKEEIERRKKEDFVNIESGRQINQKLDDFQNRQRGQGPVQQLSERGQKLKDVVEANQVPQVQYGARGLPANHNFRYLYYFIVCYFIWRIKFRYLRRPQKDWLNFVVFSQYLNMY